MTADAQRGNLVEVIRAATAGFPDKLAVVDGAIELSYGRLLAAVDTVAEALVARGIAPLDRVAFLCEDGADYIIGSLAILRCGAVVVPVSPSLMGDEVDSILTRMDVQALLYDEAVHRSAAGRRLVTPGFRARTFSLAPRAARNDLPPEYRHLHPAFIRFSSGTTGESKGVLLSHETIVDRTDAADGGLHVTPDDVVVWVLSMSFHFVVTILLYLRRGATILICRQPFPESFLQMVGRHRGTLFYASPFHYHLLAASPLVQAEALSRVRLAVSTAMTLSPETAEAFARKFGVELTEAYGIIEVGLPCLNAGRAVRQRGCVGRVLPGYEVRIAAPDADGSGVIHLRGKGMLDAYVSPWAGRAAALPDGWFNTGDIGRVDGDGHVFILGRAKAVINFVGMKIFPDEVEAVLDGHPAVKESLVYGEPHPLYGQMPCAALVLRDGAAAPGADALRRFCFERLAPHKVPKTFRVVPRLERGASGKPRRTPPAAPV